VRRWAALLLGGLLLGSSAGAQDVAPGPTPLRIQTKPVPLNPSQPRQTQVGALNYAGGVQLTARGRRLHGLSDLKLALPGRHDGRVAYAVTDQGDQVEMVLYGVSSGPPRGAERGVIHGSIRPLLDATGAPVVGKRRGDAGGLAALEDGFLVSFEREHRIWLYPAPGRDTLFRAFASKPRPFAAPQADLPDNQGFEALAVARARGGPVVVVGAENGRIWFCPAAGDGACTLEFPAGGPEAFYSLTGLDHLPGTTDLAAIYRAYDPVRGTRAIVARVATGLDGGPKGITVLARLQPPLVTENFEGIAALARPGGGWRLFLLSDDNVSKSQRTLLLAFDYQPATKKGPAATRAPSIRR